MKAENRALEYKRLFLLRCIGSQRRYEYQPHERERNGARVAQCKADRTIVVCCRRKQWRGRRHDSGRRARKGKRQRMAVPCKQQDLE